MVLMEGKHGVGKVLERLDSACPSGFAIALHIKFSSPRYLFQAYPAEWIAYYTANGLVMRDPTVHWGFENTGHIRWSALEVADRSVMLKAAE